MPEKERSLRDDINSLGEERIARLAGLAGLEDPDIQLALEGLPLGTRVAFDQMELVRLEETEGANFAVTALAKLPEAIRVATEKQSSAPERPVQN